MEQQPYVTPQPATNIQPTSASTSQPLPVAPTPETASRPTRIAAVGDIHVRETDEGKWVDFFRAASEQAEVLLLCGDLTDHGYLSEAQVLAKELKSCTIPVVFVLGNHDHDKGQHEEIRKCLISENVHYLDGDSVVLKNVGFAGVKGFGGGFDQYMLSMFGESDVKHYVQTAVDEALKLESALSRLDTEHPNMKKVVLMHYSPIKATIMGEPEPIWPFLGCSRLAEPLNRQNVTACFHGHAHMGTLEGRTSKDVGVFNVAKHILERAGYPVSFFLFDV